MGVEAAGVIEAVGADVTDFTEGDRVTYTGSPLGAYSTERVMSADHLIRLPDTIAFDTAAMEPCVGSRRPTCSGASPGWRPATPCSCTPRPTRWA